MIFPATITDGKLIIPPDVRARMAAYCQRLPNGKAVEVDVRTPKRKRTDQQNAYYWAALGELSEHTGHTPEELHDHFRWLFLRSDGADGVTTVRSTTALNTADFARYIEQCQQFAAERLDWYWPEPDMLETHEVTQ